MITNLRTAYGEALLELGAQNPQVVALEADLGKSTLSNMFGAKYPERYFQMGIAEANMVSTAAGLALAGKIPFVHSFAVFASGRAYDQIRASVAIPGLPVKICGSSAGLSDFGDGKTHQSIDDITLMRVLPGMTVLSPADAAQTRQMVFAMANTPGPVYIRINRNDLPIYHDPDAPYHIGQMDQLKEGKDIAIFATGVMVSKALAAATALAQQGISARVINASCIKPLDKTALWQYASDVKAVLTCEEHSIYGGLGSAVAEGLSTSGKPIEILGINDRFGTSAQGYEELLTRYGLSETAVLERALALIHRF